MDDGEVFKMNNSSSVYAMKLQLGQAPHLLCPVRKSIQDLSCTESPLSCHWESQTWWTDGHVDRWTYYKVNLLKSKKSIFSHFLLLVSSHAYKYSFMCNVWMLYHAIKTRWMEFCAAANKSPFTSISE